MSSDPEALLAKYQTDFAAFENFLQRDPKKPFTHPQHPTPPPTPAAAVSGTAGATATKAKLQRRVDPNETVLDMEDEHESEGEASNRTEDGAAQNSFQDDAPPRNGTTQGSSASPAARPPAPRAATSASSAAAVARAIAAHGGLEGPLYDLPGGSSAGRGRGTVRKSSMQSSSDSPSRHAGGAHPLHNTRTTHATASARRAPSAQLDEVDQLIEARLQSAGRYTSSTPPDAMYIKSQAWALRRRQINEALRREQEDTQLSECTFQPQLGPAAEAETASAYLPSLEDDGPYAAAGITLREDPGVAQHLARQEAARRQREAAQARLDGAERRKWTGRPTVPHEFKLGGRVAEAIPSLRKPCVPEKGEVEPWLVGARGLQKAESKPRVAFGATTNPEKMSAPPPSHTKASDKAKTQRNGSGSGGHAAAAVRRRPTESSVPQSAGHPPLIAAPALPSDDDYDADVQLVAASAQSTPRSSGQEAASNDLVRRLSDQLARKDAIIDAQMEDLDRLHRELEAVKETLQQIASLGTVQR